MRAWLVFLLKILITGGAGFIGKYLVENLAKNHAVLVYDDLSNCTQSDVDYVVSKGAMFSKGNILDYEKLSEFGRGVDTVIHLAAKSDVSESVIHPEITNDVNVRGTQNVLQCCVENKIKKIIFASSAAIYGDCKENPISEKSIADPLSPYGKSKLDAEKIIADVCVQNKINYVILRMFNVYGKGQNENYAGVITKFLKEIEEKNQMTIYGDGKQTRDFISILDIVDAFDCAIKSQQNGMYNIGSGKATSINDLARKIKLNSDKDIKIQYREKQQGSIVNSIADVELARKELNFFAKRDLNDQLTSIDLVSN